MKYLIFILSVLFGASPLFAQQPTISYLMCDEAKSQLQIHGSFGKDSGSVSIEDTTLGIASWSDSLIICNLPDSGKGAGGHVEVQTIHGASNKRSLSIIYLEIFDARYEIDEPNVKTMDGEYFWHCNWRADFGSRPANANPFSFEISKSSNGSVQAFQGLPLHWTDSILFKDTSISIKGTIDLDSNLILLRTIYMGCGFEQKSLFTGRIIYIPSLMLKFDTFGYLANLKSSFSESVSGIENDFDLSGSHILFPPSTKSNVSSTGPINVDITVHLDPPLHQLLLQSTSPLGLITASLYTIDGRLLKKTKLDISAPGNYSIDVSDVHTHFAILVLQTAKGVITKKILLSEP